MTRRLLLVASLVGALAMATAGAFVLTGATGAAPFGQPAPQLTTPPPVNPVVVGAQGTVVPWFHPLSLRIDSGTLVSVSALGPGGLELPGTLTPMSWLGRSSLVPGQPYQLRAVIKEADGKTSTVERLLTASPPTKVLHATISPGHGGTYGVGQPVIVRFDKQVKGAAARSAVLSRLQVVTKPAVEGAWRWYNSFEVHYRSQAYWRPGTTISTTATLSGLRVPGTEVWGATAPQSRTITIGRALVGTVDISAHTLTVRRDGKVVKVFKVSTGREEYPTKGGVHIVLLREREHLYNSATVGIPTASPDGYYHKLPWSVRISNGGAFVHANPSTVRYQGSRNVSHGCVNMSVADAKWFYDNSLLGDVVNVIHAVVPPNRQDAGMSDWNYSWDTWRAGNLDG